MSWADNVYLYLFHSISYLTKKSKPYPQLPQPQNCLTGLTPTTPTPQTPCSPKALQRLWSSSRSSSRRSRSVRSCSRRCSRSSASCAEVSSLEPRTTGGLPTHRISPVASPWPHTIPMLHSWPCSMIWKSPNINPSRGHNLHNFEVVPTLKLKSKFAWLECHSFYHPKLLSHHQPSSTRTWYSQAYHSMFQYPSTYQPSSSVHPGQIPILVFNPSCSCIKSCLDTHPASNHLKIAVKSPFSIPSESRTAVAAPSSPPPRGSCGALAPPWPHLPLWHAGPGLGSVAISRDFQWIAGFGFFGFFGTFPSSSMKLFLFPRCPCKFDVPLGALESGLDSTLDTPRQGAGRFFSSLAPESALKDTLKSRNSKPSRESRAWKMLFSTCPKENSSWVPLCLWVLLKFGGTPVKNDHLRWLMGFPTENLPTTETISPCQDHAAKLTAFAAVAS